MKKKRMPQLLHLMVQNLTGVKSAQTNLRVKMLLVKAVVALAVVVRAVKVAGVVVRVAKVVLVAIVARAVKAVGVTAVLVAKAAGAIVALVVKAVMANAALAVLAVLHSLANLSGKIPVTKDKKGPSKERAFFVVIKENLEVFLNPIHERI
jgi:hypothetical protein